MRLRPDFRHGTCVSDRSITAPALRHRTCACGIIPNSFPTSWFLNLLLRRCLWRCVSTSYFSIFGNEIAGWCRWNCMRCAVFAQFSSIQANVVILWTVHKRLGVAKKGDLFHI